MSSQVSVWKALLLLDGPPILQVVADVATGTEIPEVATGDAEGAKARSSAATVGIATVAPLWARVLLPHLLEVRLLWGVHHALSLASKASALANHSAALAGRSCSSHVAM